MRLIMIGTHLKAFQNIFIFLQVGTGVGFVFNNYRAGRGKMKKGLKEGRTI